MSSQAKVLTLCQLGLLRPITSDYLIDETERILSEKSPRLLPTFERLQTRINWEFVPEPDDDEVSKWKTLVPENDAPISAAAVLAKVKRLVTLDVKDFIRMPQVAEKSGLMIVTPRDLLVEIRAVLAQGFSKNR